jgi:hypothetical protein
MHSRNMRRGASLGQKSETKLGGTAVGDIA